VFETDRGLFKIGVVRFMLKIVVVVGTRPQIIKTATVISRLKRMKKCNVSVVHTGQHYDYELSKVFLKEMSLPDPVINLGVRADTHTKQTAAMMLGLERVLANLSPHVVLIPGDTNSALATALTANKLRTPYAHLESGPRQFDLSNPEEANRIVVDHLCTIAFAPCPSAVRNLVREGFARRRIAFTGDTMLDCLIEHLPSSLRVDVKREFGIEPGYVFTTIHRQENTEDPARLNAIVQTLLSTKRLRFVFPVHPRTAKNLKHFGWWKSLVAARNVCLLPPVDYEHNLALLSKAVTVMTDSGGLQKEAFWLGVPCVTVFRSTPWPETLREGANVCAEPTRGLKDTLLRFCSIKFDRSRSFRVFGNGKASERVCRVLLERFSRDSPTPERRKVHGGH
jgi:UDP-N-acetylglucosamine 2-epimerase